MAVSQEQNPWKKKQRWSEPRPEPRRQEEEEEDSEQQKVTAEGTDPVSSGSGHTEPRVDL